MVVEHKPGAIADKMVKIADKPGAIADKPGTIADKPGVANINGMQHKKVLD